MPNWCNNTITIEGPVGKIRALWDSAQPAEGKDGSLLEAMVPIGEWQYNTAVGAWGTKWDVSLEGLEFADLGNGRAEITGYADSAWNPPLEAFLTYANENADVYMEIRYFDPGSRFIGVWDSEGSNAYWEHVDSLLKTTAEEDAVLYDLLDHFDAWDCYETDEDS